MQITATNTVALANAFKGLDESAQTIATSGGQNGGGINAINEAVFRVNLTQDARANVAAIRAADAAEGTLLDVIA